MTTCAASRRPADGSSAEPSAAGRPVSSAGSKSRPSRRPSPSGSSRSADHPAVRTRTPRGTRSRPVTRVPSWIVTPSSTATRARPRHSLAGSSMTASSGPTDTPACQSGEWTSAWTASRSRKTSRSPRAFASSTQARSSPTACGRSATVSTPVGSRSQSIPWSRVKSMRSRRFSRPSDSRRSTSSGKWRSPLARPWTRLASQNPPLRPLAPNPTTAASRTTMRRPGSVSASRIAVHRPVNPAPTMATSARAGPRSGGRGSDGWRSSQ